VLETGRSIAQVARELGVNAGTLANWVALERHRQAQAGGISPDERAELVRLRKENAELRMRCDVLKRSVALWVNEACATRRCCVRTEVGDRRGPAVVAVG
jgi:transposase